MTVRVPKADVPAELKEAMAQRFAALPEPVEVLFNSPDVATSNLEFSARVAGWNAADASLKSFAHMAVAAQIGCGWCLDAGYFQAQNEHLDLAKASQVPRWRESDVFSPLEREVLAYAEDMSATPPAVTDEQSASLLAQLGPAALVELTLFIGYVNLATRSNVAHGIASQGYSDACEIPLAARPGGTGRGETPAAA
ncbi:carboxymuconolactone decarboxylase family protein [Streptomyces sp. MAR4 CNX-425]|uniref:carboxymuconolactone decarboxylase family protein n=1 Tax=Streptomyces sp. MAR4 CNX-425 TaxID=3406343 RepID=UPI003B501C06